MAPLAASSRPHVLIIGGGIGGLSTAIALSRAGLAVTVLERASQRGGAGAGIGLSPDGLRALDQLGLRQAVLPFCKPIRSFEIRTRIGKVLARVSGRAVEDLLGYPAACLHRADLLGVLAGAVNPSAVKMGKKCIGLAESDSKVVASFDDGTEETGDALIGADGLRSTIRARLWGERKPRYAGYTAARGIAMIESDRHDPGAGFEAWGRGRRFGLFDLGQGRAYWYAAWNCVQQASDSGGDQKGLLLEMFRDWNDPIPQAIARTPDPLIIRTDIFDRPPRRPWGRGRITLLGDAAHPATPDLGQGAALAMEDALVLSRCLSGSRELVSGLRRYEALRWKRTSWLVRLSFMAGAIGQVQGRTTSWMRDLLVKFALAPVSLLR